MFRDRWRTTLVGLGRGRKREATVNGSEGSFVLQLSGFLAVNMLDQCTRFTGSQVVKQLLTVYTYGTHARRSTDGCLSIPPQCKEGLPLVIPTLLIGLFRELRPRGPSARV